MAKKTKRTMDNGMLFFIIILIVGTLLVFFYLANNETQSPDALAAQAGAVLECAPGTKPQYTCMGNISSQQSRPKNWKTMTGQQRKTYIKQLIADYKANCTWECVPLPSGIEYVKPSGLPVVTPPAGILKPTLEPYPKPICVDVYCPLNCVQKTNIGGCPFCSCDSIVVQ